MRSKISVFTFLDVSLVLHVQSDCSIPLHLRSHEKKDIFSGSIVKIPAVSMHRFEGIFMHALWHNKENSRNIYLNRVTMYITSKSLGLILCKMDDEAVWIAIK